MENVRVEETTLAEVSKQIRKQRKKGPGRRNLMKTSSFIGKMAHILSSGEHSDAIAWSPDGASVIIVDVRRLEETVLPRFFKHRNYHSFVRQLNMYGFHKMKRAGPLEAFDHAYFRRGHEYLSTQPLSFNSFFLL
eukprot:TRINITY_DN3073_c0_g2_i2.p1 TRINITY_DN3073_c0_g2~~TRINITY_DN3073_c0_g2_i2.p1  ORF type:complete len:135 (-),score=9.05 TRINITY_DN3073_c0_g2_i2:146-550(-)